MDQPGKVANPARGQLNRKNEYLSCPRTCLRIWSRETGSAVPSRVSLLILHTQAESGAYLRDSSRVPRRRPTILYIYTYTCVINSKLDTIILKKQRDATVDDLFVTLQFVDSVTSSNTKTPNPKQTNGEYKICLLSFTPTAFKVFID